MAALKFPQFLRRYGVRLLFVSDGQVVPSALLKKQRQGYMYQGHLKNHLNGSSADWQVGMNDASIVYGSITHEIDLTGQADLNEIGLRISGGLSRATSISFVLKDVRVKVPLNKDPIRLVGEINALRKDKKEVWRLLNGLWVVDKTFHAAEFEVSISSRGGSDMRAELDGKIDVGGKLKWKSTSDFTVTNNEAVPFGFTGFKI